MGCERVWSHRVEEWGLLHLQMRLPCARRGLMRVCDRPQLIQTFVHQAGMLLELCFHARRERRERREGRRELGRELRSPPRLRRGLRRGVGRGLRRGLRRDVAGRKKRGRACDTRGRPWKVMEGHGRPWKKRGRAWQRRPPESCRRQGRPARDVPRVLGAGCGRGGERRRRPVESTPARCAQ